MCAAPHVSKDFEKLKSPSELDGLSELLSSEGVTDVFLELQSTSTDKPQLIRFLKSRASASLLALEIRSDEPILLEVIPAFENLSELERLHFNRFCVLDAQLSELLKVPLPRLVDLGLFGTGISVEGAALLASSVLGAQLERLLLADVDTAGAELLMKLPNLKRVELLGVTPSDGLHAQLPALRLRGAEVLFTSSPARHPAPTRGEIAARIESILAEPPSFMTFNRLLDTLVYCDDERFKQEFQTQCENVVGRWPISFRCDDQHQLGFWARPCASLVKMWILSDFSESLLRSEMEGPPLPGITHLELHFKTAEVFAKLDWGRFTGLEEVVLRPELKVAAPAMIESWRFPGSVTRVDISHAAKYWFDAPRAFFRFVERLKRIFPGLKKVFLGRGWVDEHNALSGGQNAIEEGWLQTNGPAR